MLYKLTETLYLHRSCCICISSALSLVFYSLIDKIFFIQFLQILLHMTGWFRQPVDNPGKPRGKALVAAHKGHTVITEGDSDKHSKERKIFSSMILDFFFFM